MARMGLLSKFVSRPEVKSIHCGWDLPRFLCGLYNQEATCRSSRGNMKSALENPHVNGKYLHAECEVGRVIGPLDPSSHLQVHTSRFGVIPKSAPGKWRLIVDMSFLEGGSV